MKKIDEFVNLYSISKTLRFSLIPQGKTEQYFNEREMLKGDKELSQNYEKVKKIIDKYHKTYIDKQLDFFSLSGLEEYAEVFENKNQNEEKFKTLQKSLRKQICDRLTKTEEFKNLFEKELIQSILPNTNLTEEDKSVIKKFDKFTTYFKGFQDNRKNMYSCEGKSTEICYRLIDQNFPKFYSNMKVGKQIKEQIDSEIIAKLNVDLSDLTNNILEIFELNYFNKTLTQSGIDTYNQIIGGYTNNNGDKIQGFNEIINEYNQKHDKKIPKLKVLYKQILSDRSSLSFIPEQMEKKDICTTINVFYSETNNNIEEMIKLLENVKSYDLTKIYISAKYISTISNKVFGYWGAIKEEIVKQYDEKHLTKSCKNIEKYEENRKKYFDKIKSFSIANLDDYCKNINDSREEKVENIFVENTIKEIVHELKNALDKSYSEVKDILNDKSNQQDENWKGNIDEKVAKIKAFLDSILEIQGFAKNFVNLEENGDLTFYGIFDENFEKISDIIALYNVVRNCLTAKPYSTEKLKLNFENSLLLDGWAKSRENITNAIILRDCDKYYLGIIPKDEKIDFSSCSTNSDNIIEKMEFEQMADPSKDIPNLMIIDGKAVKKNGRKNKFNENIILEELKNTYLPTQVNEIRKKFGYGVSREKVTDEEFNAFINYYKKCVKGYYDKFKFNFKDNIEYNHWNDFVSDVNGQAYQITFVKIDKNSVNYLVEEGKLYLFLIYNKDFSEYSHGKANLHTMYFKELFSEENLKNTVIALGAGSEIFYREASIKNDKPTHPKNQPIQNKNPLNEKKTSTFNYDLIKDKRYTKRQFLFHVPININFKAKGIEKINGFVRNALRECNKNYCIGIDRGERNLLSICVIDNNGKIVEQFSGNVLQADNYNFPTDYHQKLENREKERLEARQEWKNITDIKNLKEGYLSLMIHQICGLVEKYDAIIVMEDLNSGFKNSRAKIESSVYQKFEKMLIDKLNYCVDKNKEKGENGYINKGYQLTEKFESFTKMGKQNGFIFYIPAWNTSKIDPVTGFVDLLKPKYSSVESAKEFFENFDSIKYNKQEDYFEFKFNYNNFLYADIDYKKQWTVCSYGDRIRTFKNKEGKFETEKVNVTTSLKDLFKKFNICYDNKQELKNLILIHTEKEFFISLIYNLQLVLQMRNSDSKTGEDYIISPIKNEKGFYDSRNYKGRNAELPIDADANGAYNIARKGLWAINNICSASEEEYRNAKISIKNKEWLEFAQK